MSAQHDLATPSQWVVRWAPLIKAGTVLDVACGNGRHTRYFAGRGLRVVAVDRDSRQFASPNITFVRADLEDGSPWPFAGQRFAGIVVTNYLHRPLMPKLEESLAEGGVLIYETFMLGNERFGRPSNPDFLLRPGELRETFKRLRIEAFEEGQVDAPKPAMIQRVCAVKAPKE